MNLILRLIISATMILAGWYAHKNAEYLEYIVVDAGWSNWFLSAYISRILTGSLVGLGAILVLLPAKKKIIVKSALLLTAGLLLLSLIQILVLDLTRCYVCLGELEKFSKYQGIVIWTIVLLLLIIVYRGIDSVKGFMPKWATWLVFIAGLSVPFILNYPAHWAVYGEVPGKDINRDLELSKLDSVEFLAGNHAFDASVWEGKRVLMMASLSCPFCSRATYKIHVLRKQYPDFPITIMLTGDTLSLKTFKRRNLMDNVPFLLFNGPEFNEICQGRVPRIYLVENGIATREVTYWGLFPNILD